MKIAACRGWVILLFRASASFLYETLFYPPFFKRTMRKFSELNSCGVLPSIHSSLFLLAVIWLHMHFCKHVYKYNMDVQVLIVPNYPSSLFIRPYSWLSFFNQLTHSSWSLAPVLQTNDRTHHVCWWGGRPVDKNGTSSPYLLKFTIG